MRLFAFHPSSVRGAAVNRLLALLAPLFLLLSMAAGSVLHAAEPQGVPTASTLAAVVQVAFDHSATDTDQVPADTDRGVPHHHGGCHGDHVASPASRAAPGRIIAVRAGPVRSIAAVRPRATADPALRPPRA